MSCLDNIVTLGTCPDTGASLSGFTLLQAPGMSTKILDNIANENYVQGQKLAMVKKAVTLTQFRNDFIGALQANNVITQVAYPLYTTSTFKPEVNKGTYAGERGVILHKNLSKQRGYLRKTKIKAVQCYPLASGSGSIQIHDGINTASIAVEFVANKINTFSIEYVLPDDCFAAKILIDQTNIAFCSAPITCLKGCNNTMPNDCAWADGWNGTQAIKDEGFGINVQFGCYCEYDRLICDLSSSFTGELIWLKWRYNILEEQYQTNRFTNWVIYNRDEIWEKILPDLERQYMNKWQALIDGLINIVKNYRDGCLECRGIRRKTNL